MSSVQLISSNFSFNVSNATETIFYLWMAAIQIPKSVFGLMITVCSNSFETYQSPNAACLLLVLIVNQQLGSLRMITRPWAQGFYEEGFEMHLT